MGMRLAVLTASAVSNVGLKRGPAVLLIAWLAGCATPPAAAAQNDPASGQPPGGQQATGGEQESPDYNGLDYTRPQQNAEVRLESRESSSSPTSKTDREIEFLKLATKVQLPDGWRLGLQGQLPFVEKTTTDLGNPPSVDREAGLGNAFAQLVLARSIDSHWAYGFGARLVAPTAEDSLGNGKWQIMPGFGVRYSFLEVSADTYFVPSIRYAMSFAGDPTAPKIRQAQIAPTFNLALSDHWFMTFYPSNDIRINYGDPVSGQTGRLFLPFDAAVGRKFGDRFTATLELSVPIIRNFPVYNFKSELRLTVQF